MIDLTKFTEKDLKLIEKLIDDEIDGIYRRREKFKHSQFLGKEDPTPFIVLKTKILNMKHDESN